MRHRRPALIWGMVHRVRWAPTKVGAGHTSCGISFFAGTERWWTNDRVQPAEIVLRPVDCMACIAARAQ